MISTISRIVIACIPTSKSSPVATSPLCSARAREFYGNGRFASWLPPARLASISAFESPAFATYGGVRRNAVLTRILLCQTQRDPLTGLHPAPFIGYGV